jgi:hypothetical protein
MTVMTSASDEDDKPNAPTESRREKSSRKAKKRGPQRLERRFVAQSANNPWLARVLGGLGATTLGAGTWGYMYGHAFDADEKLKPIPSYLIAAGAILTGATIWFGTSSETPLRVGAPGISMERGEVRRMPWSSVSQITWESGNLALVIAGADEAGAAWTFKVPVKAHAEAAGWILKEALDRVPKRVDIDDAFLDQLPGASPHAGTVIELEPLQVVGKKDAITGKTISYEPDARVCPRCERVYFKRSVPKKCKCGASLLELRAALTEDTDEDETEDDETEDDETEDDETEDDHTTTSERT